jgi:signal transduction histidine kinase/HAMP domain-containing protein
VNRNLITRMGIASGLVACLVAVTFGFVLRAVEDMREASSRQQASAERLVRLARADARPDVLAREALVGEAAEQRAEDAELRAKTLGVVGIGGSSVLLLLLTWYLAQAIVVPVRRTASAAKRLAAGDLTARVVEEGDAEPVELARSFNRMAASLQAQQGELAGQNRELGSQRLELEHALGQLEAEKRRVERFYRVGERLSSALEIDALAHVALQELGDAAGADVGVLYAVTPDDPRTLSRAATRGLHDADLPGALHPGDGLAGRALAERRTITGARTGQPLRLPAFGREVGVRHEAHVPLRLGDRVLGVVSLARLDDRPFEDSRLYLVERLADQAAVALSNVVSFRRALRQARINRAVLDATPDPVGLFDVEGRLVVQNEPMAVVTSEIGDERDVDLPGEDPDREARDEVTVGARTYSRYAAPVRDATGARMGRVVVLNDVSAERESERMKDEFFALVSHELRTPLTSIIGYLELVLGDEEDLSEDARRFLEVVQRNGKRLLRLVGDMLFVAQVEAGRLSLERSTIDLWAIASEAVEAARPQADRGRVQLGLQADRVPPMLGDRDRFGQMLDNLISNALKFTPDGGHVEVRLLDAGDRAVLEISDDGIGIAPADQAQLFERFYRSQVASERQIQGAGLGLTIVRTIVEAHGGTITLSSREGVGTTFRVELPYQQPALVHEEALA